MDRSGGSFRNEIATFAFGAPAARAAAGNRLITVVCEALTILGEKTAIL
jgi:hypothetical protein